MERLEALENGYVKAIAMDVAGYVSEGSGENLYIVWDGTLIVPPLGVHRARDSGRTGDILLLQVPEVTSGCREKEVGVQPQRNQDNILVASK